MDGSEENWNVRFNMTLYEIFFYHNRLETADAMNLFRSANILLMGGG